MQTEIRKSLPQKLFVAPRSMDTPQKPSFVSQEQQRQISQQKPRTTTRTYRVAELGKEEQAPQMVSLDVLKQEIKKAEKPANSNNLETLKDTLRTIMEKEKIGNERDRGDKSKTSNSDTKVEERENNKPNKPQEIPRNVLEEMLKIKDE